MVKLGEEIFDMGRDAGQASLNSKFAPDVFKYSLNYFVGDYQAVGFNQPFGNWINEPVIAADLADKQLYNGNIRAMYVQAPNVKNALHFYKYDALNRISHSFSYEKAKVNRWFSNNNITKRYQTDYEYDGAGNLSHLTRKDQNASTFDRLTYHYDATNKNRLLQVTDAVGINIKPDDFDSQVNADNYVYDLLGRVVEDKAKNLTQTYNKENKIITQTIGSKVITYKYDFQSKRISKTVVNAGLTTTEYYVRDPQGNVLAIYADTLQNGRKFTLSELHIYGSSRLGTNKVDSVLYSQNGSTIVVATSSNKYSFKLGQKRYELSNLLGNVSTVISDRKLVDVQTNGIITAYKADVQSVTDYYPFGKTIPERAVSKNRYDFNGKETDAESGYQDYGFRDYYVEIARFLQVDPLHGKYPWNSTYCFAENDVMRSIDLDGLEKLVVIAVPYNPTQIDGIKIEKKDANLSWQNAYNDYNKIEKIYNNVKDKLQQKDNFELEVKPSSTSTN